VRSPVRNDHSSISLSLEADAMSGGPDWIMSILAGALGGLLVLLPAVAVRNAYRLRDRTSPPQSALAATMPLVDDSSTAWPSAAGGDGVATSSRLSPGSALIGYVTVAADPDASEEDESAAAIAAACERSAWRLLDIVRDRDEGPTLDRSGLRYALERIADGQAQGLLVSDLEPLSRSIVDLGALMAWFRDTDATLIALDLDIDTSTPEGRHVATTLIALSARDHQRIASGTRRGLAKGRAGGRASGRPAVSHRPELVERIAEMRAANMTLSAIAEQLNAEGVPTLRGGRKWRPSSIQATLGYQRPRPRDHLPSPRKRAGP
jgi:DNA invertase Pin-like site-specific DNA recombinase